MAVSFFWIFSSLPERGRWNSVVYCDASRRNLTTKDRCRSRSKDWIQLIEGGSSKWLILPFLHHRLHHPISLYIPLAQPTYPFASRRYISSLYEHLPSSVLFFSVASAKWTNFKFSLTGNTTGKAPPKNETQGSITIPKTDFFQRNSGPESEIWKSKTININNKNDGSKIGKFNLLNPIFTSKKFSTDSLTCYPLPSTNIWLKIPLITVPNLHFRPLFKACCLPP